MTARLLHVVVVAHSRETLDGLHAYLGGAGVDSRGTRTLTDLAAVPSSAAAVVVFPDDFDEGAAAALLRTLRDARPALLIVAVTGKPQAFRGALDRGGRGVPPVVLPKPAFGWTILDAIRTHADSIHT